MTDPRRLGKYEVLARIGQGSMGEVFRAHDPILGREVAIKTMSAAIGADAELRKRFQREAQSAARLNHPNIITVHDFGEEQGQAYMAMELLEGSDLKDLISRRATLTLADKLALMEQMAEGLAFAHAKGIVHRDLKPANIHVAHGGQVKIMDFGLARLSTSDMTRAGMIMGTPNYMAPEQVRGEKVTAQSDVFALGAVFYELLSYRKAFDAGALHAVLFKVMQAEPEPLATLVPDLPSSLCALVEKAMAKEPAGRPRDAGEIREALRTVRAELASAHTQVPATTILATRAAVALEPAHRPISAATVPASAATLIPAAPPTVRPAPTVRAEVPPALRTPRPVLPARRRKAMLAAGLASGVVIVAGGYVGYRVMQWRTPVATLVPAPPSAAPTTPLTSPSPVRPFFDADSALTQARGNLADRDYRAAATRAEAVLAAEPANVTAQQLLDGARRGIARGEAEVRALKAALSARDAEDASAVLARVLTLDPRHPELPQLTLRVNALLSDRAREARQPPPVTARPSLAPPITAPPATLPRPPVTTIPPVPVQSEAAARQSIRGVLDEYRQAFESRNVDALKAVQPSVDYAAMKRVFDSVTAYSIKLQMQTITVNGDRATATAIVTYAPTPKPAGKIKPILTLFHLRRSGEVWLIESVGPR